MIRVAVVADSPVLRAGVGALLSGEPDVRVDSEEDEHDDRAHDGHVRDDTDVLVWVPRNAALHHIMRWHDEADRDRELARVPTVVLLEQMDADVRRDAYAGGASAVLPLDVRGPELIAAVRAAANGLVVMQPAVSLEMAALTRTSQRRAELPVSLTPREQEVLTLLARGLANKAMAVELGITEHTVKTHVAAVYEKLGSGNRAEAVVAAARQGLIMI
jgi:DNA-binding NarL/FixJ family response regulator